MKIRSRLIFGLLTIAIVLLVPFVFMLYQLEALRRSTQRLQQNEFAGSIMVGRVRASAEELGKSEGLVAFDTLRSSANAMSNAHRALVSRVDSLILRLPGGKSPGFDSALRTLGPYIAEHERIARAGTPEAEARADTIRQRHLLPALEAIETRLPILERELDDSTGSYFRNATAAAAAAEQVGLVALVMATLLALAIAVWLTRSISEPVSDLERAMQTVADGDFSYALRTEESAPAEFSTLSRSYRSMVGQLAELDKLKAEFVSVASHELKTPINVVIGYLQLLDEGVYGELNPKQREILQLLEVQSQSLARLAHQLLDVSRFEAGGGRLETRPIDLSRFFGELEGSFAVLAIQRKIEFRVRRDANLPTTVEWDQDRISEVVGNILSNAFKFTSRGGTVELSVYNADDGVRIEIRDSGAGIPANQLPWVFEKFYQAANQTEASQKGTGLGLAIAREIVEAHQGTIGVESTVGVGTTFVITLPRIAAGGRSAVSRRRTPAMPMHARK